MTSERSQRGDGGGQEPEPGRVGGCVAVKTRLGRLNDLALFFLVVVPLFAVFFATARTDRPYHIDAFSNAVAAWNLAENGSLYLDDYEEFTAPEYRRSVGWFVAVDGGTVTQYPPGAALWAAPFYAVAPGDAQYEVVRPTNTRDEFDTVVILIPPLAPAAAAAALAAAMAMGWLALTFRRYTTTAVAVVGALVVAVGTSAWGVASDSLWQHGPGMMWVALGGYLAATDRLWGSGFAYGMAILTRPPLALIAAAVGLAIAWRERSLRSAVHVGLGAGVGLGGVVLYNAIVFGSPSLSGGYAPTFVEEALSPDFVGYAQNIAGALFDTNRGLLVWSPFLIVLLMGLVVAWRAAPAAVRGGAVGGLVYFAVQLKANRYSGGVGFVGYRYPLEPLIAAAPLLLLAYRDWVAANRVRIVGFLATTVYAVLIQAAAAVL